MVRLKEKNKTEKVEVIMPQFGPWVFSDVFLDLVEKLRVKYSIKEDHRIAFDNIILDIFLQKVPFDKLPQVIMSTLFVDKGQAQKIAIDLVGSLVLPVAIYFKQNPFTEFHKWGGKDDDYKPPKEMMSIYEAIARIEEEIEAEEEFERSIAGDVSASSDSIQYGEAAQADILLDNYRLHTIDWAKVLETGSRLRKLKDIKKLLHQFHQAINKRDREKILASLLILARQGKLDEIFEIDQKIKDIFAQHLQKKFSEKLAQHFLQNLRQPVYISYFLQHLLKDILKLDENESAVIAIKLANELKRAGDKQYLAIAYGDLSDGTFKWKTIVEEDAKLTLADK